MAYYQRDERFYMTDGNVTILVSTVIFKIHRHILSRDGSSFANMFSLDNQGTTANDFQQEGNSDEKPVKLQGDKPEEFRDLLWCLYALPQEIAASMSPQADVVQLANVLRMAHKYHFLTTESWATTTILQYLKNQLPTPLPTQTLVKITEVAVLCGDEKILDIALQKWKRLIGEKKELALSLITTERLGLRELQGLSYQAMLLEGRQSWEKETLLSRDQRIRLLSGYHNIAIFAESIPDNPPHFDHVDECRDTPKCRGQWIVMWKDITDIDPADEESGIVHPSYFTSNKHDLVSRTMMLVSIMQAIKDEPAMFLGNYEFAKSPCIGAALKVTIAFSRKTQGELMDFFLDVY